MIDKLKYVATRPLVALPIPSTVLGPPKGTYESALNALKTSSVPLGTLIAEDQPYEYVQKPAKTVEDEAKFFQGRREVLHPYAALFPKGRVYGDEGIVILPDDRIALDMMPLYYIKTKHLVGAGLRILRRFKLPKLRRIGGRVINLSLGETRNYSHWTFQNMTRLQFLKRHGIDADYYYVDVSQPFQREYLNLMGIPPEKIIPVEKEIHIEAGELIVVGGCSHNQVPHPELLRRVRDTVLGSAIVSPTRRLYISREDAPCRRVSNEAEVMRYLAPLGFERVVMAGKSVLEQAHLLQQASVVVGPHGANMTNIIFCRQGSHILEIFQPGWIDSGYTAPSDQLGLQYYYALGGVTNPPPELRGDLSAPTGCRFSAKSYEIRLDRLERFMRIVSN